MIERLNEYIDNEYQVDKNIKKMSLGRSYY